MALSAAASAALKKLAAAAATDKNVAKTIGGIALLDLLGEREEVAAARLDFDEDVIALELNPAFVSGMTMQMQ